jgi:hypothetical protein
MSRPTSRRLKKQLSRLAVRVGDRLSGMYSIQLAYPPPRVGAAARYTNALPELETLLAERHDTYRSVIGMIERYDHDLRGITELPGTPPEPYWGQQWFTNLDASALYSFIRERRPRVYYEIGSGNSTLFAARAVRDGGLDTRIVAVDPEPRADVTTVSDELVRLPLQDSDLSTFAELRAGDVVLVDSSHYALPNSDVVVFMLRVLPSLPSGVLVGVHDICLPEDYPWWLEDRWYSEAYVLAAWLLGMSGRANIVFPAHYVSTRLKSDLDAAVARGGWHAVFHYGGAFWFET